MHLEVKINVIKTEKMSFMPDMMTPYLMVKILLSHGMKKKNDLPIAMSKMIVSILFVWLLHKLNQLCLSHSLSGYWYPIDMINFMITDRSTTFHPEVVMVFECETAAAVDWWSVVVQSDEMGKKVGSFLMPNISLQVNSKQMLDA